MVVIHDISEVRSLLSAPQRIVILSHRNPDGDAIGSTLALRRFLLDQGHEVTGILPSDWPYVYGFLGGVRDLIIFDRNRDAAIDAIKQSTVIFLLDLNAIDRIDEMGPAVMESDATRILIDHHLEPEKTIAHWMLSDPGASSTAELIYVFLEMLGSEDKLTPEIAEGLFTGIITDTGSFRFSTNPRVFQVCAKLKEAGVDDYRLQNMIYNSMTEKQLRLIGHCIANRMELLHEYSTGIMHLTQQDFKDFSIGRGDTDGIVNFILMMRNMRIAAFITDQASVIKLSFRSKGKISVQELARNYYGGGGHRNAAGGSSKKTLDEVLAEFKEILPGYLAEQGVLTNSEIAERSK